MQLKPSISHFVSVMHWKEADTLNVAKPCANDLCLPSTISFCLLVLLNIYKKIFCFICINYYFKYYVEELSWCMLQLFVKLTWDLMHCGRITILGLILLFMISSINVIIIIWLFPDRLGSFANCWQCYCYVCDEPAPCRVWDKHCHAYDKNYYWKTAREEQRSTQDTWVCGIM